ncbi:MAG TPA: alpha/beta hydrolase [Nocardioides sp.]|uniref:alpha/beta fold hydrolase n=1 Tax=Nocardioides sp. TaxID=35761 RepID=UPI002E334308|nr:alpha/beta hydrolase [Nocardioides sp.]HEX3931392.1 alpha/beta hydrolase [Nocardioides sp.]
MAGPAFATPETPPPSAGQTSSEPEVAVSPELFAPVSTGVELCYRTYGDPTGEPMLLLMGLASPLNWWDPELCSMLARRGYFVVILDNRDVGRSSKVAGRVTRGTLVRAFAGLPVRAPYALSDMARDAFALLDHLSIDRAHVVGVSMGGMIAQTMAVEEPARVRSLTSIMSTTGRRSVGWQSPRLFPALLRPIRPGREGYADSSVAMTRMIGSPGYPHPEQRVREVADETYDRGISASGTMRQMLAILTQPNRTPRLRELRMPTLVIHGLADRMVHISGGRATAAAIPGAELVLVGGMGHDLPPELFAAFVDAIDRTARRA